MSNEDIDRIVWEHATVLPFPVYAVICDSEQIDHILRNGDKIDLWSRDGRHWEVSVRI